MADTSHLHAPASGGPTEGDGVNYRGIVWFIAVLVVTTLVCQGLMLGLFKFLERQVANDNPARVPLAVSFGDNSPECAPRAFVGGVVSTARPCITKSGEIEAGTALPQPNLMADDPTGLEHFRAKEDEILTTYGVMDKNGGTYRIPVERAKALLLERGIPGGSQMPAATPAPAPIKK